MVERNEQGSILVLTAIALMLVVIMAGAVLDMGRALMVQNQMRNAAQAAAFAGALAYYQDAWPTISAQGGTSESTDTDTASGPALSPACIAVPVPKMDSAETVARQIFVGNYPPGTAVPQVAAEGGILSITSATCGTSTSASGGNGSLGMAVTTQQTIPFYLLSMIGLSHLTLRVTATAAVSPVAGIQSGLFPIGIPYNALQNVSPGQYPVVTLDMSHASCKGQGGDSSGNCSIIPSLQVDGQTASNFNLLRYNHTFGISQNPVCISGQPQPCSSNAATVSVKPGRTIGKVTDLLQTQVNWQRASWNGTTMRINPSNIATVSASRVILVPVVEYGPGGGANQSVTVEGFAAFYVENVQHNGSGQSGMGVITGQVIPWTPSPTQITSFVSTSNNVYDLLGFVRQTSVS